MVFQRTVFESAAEFFDACAEGALPSTVYIVHDGDDPWLSGEGASVFSLGSISWHELIQEAVKRANIKVHFT